jgi:hypothetical protein
MLQKVVACIGHAIPYSDVCHVPGASHSASSVLMVFCERHCLYFKGQMHPHPNFVQARKLMSHFGDAVQRIDSQALPMNSSWIISRGWESGYPKSVVRSTTIVLRSSSVGMLMSTAWVMWRTERLPFRIDQRSGPPQYRCDTRQGVYVVKGVVGSKRKGWWNAVRRDLALLSSTTWKVRISHRIGSTAVGYWLPISHQ